MVPPQVKKVLVEHCYQLRNRIREADTLSEPCPEGKWRWADVNSSGYGKKSEEELAADRERNKAAAVRLRGELAAIERFLTEWAS